MQIHELKIFPEFFLHILDGTKTFEIRFNDRNYLVGDQLYLREYFPCSGKYSGLFVRKNISFILDDSRILKRGYVCLSLINPK